MQFHRTLIAAALSFPAWLLANPASSQDWPTKNVVIVSPTSSSSGADIIGRALMPRLSAMWKQNVIVENRVGASGSIGMGFVARAEPDGYTILMTPNTITMLGAISKSVPWDVRNSFDPIALMARTISAVIVNNDLPVKSVAELITYIKARPGQVNYASPGVGTPQHMYGELFKQITDTNMLHVPYKTLAAGVTDLAGGRSQVAFYSLSAVMPLVHAGKLRVLATVGEQRSNITPYAPTFKEAGIDAVQAGSWIAALVPKNTPRAIADRITRDFNAILQQPDFQQVLIKASLLPNTEGGGQKQLADLIEADVTRWTKVARAGNISKD